MKALKDANSSAITFVNDLKAGDPKFAGLADIESKMEDIQICYSSNKYELSVFEERYNAIIAHWEKIVRLWDEVLKKREKYKEDSRNASKEEFDNAWQTFSDEIYTFQQLFEGILTEIRENLGKELKG